MWLAGGSCPTCLPAGLWVAGCRLVQPQAGGAAHLLLLRPSPPSHHLIKGSIDSDSTLLPSSHCYPVVKSLKPTALWNSCNALGKFPGSHLDVSDGGSRALILLHVTLHSMLPELLSSPHPVLHPNKFFEAGNPIPCVWPKGNIWKNTTDLTMGLYFMC